jgi:Putative glycolipid-binding
LGLGSLAAVGTPSRTRDRASILRSVRRSLFWIGVADPLAEVAHFEVEGNVLAVSGTQLGFAGSPYELRYALHGRRLEAEIVGGSSLALDLGHEDFVDIGFSPAANSFPIVRDGLQHDGERRTYVMAWVDVPSLEVHRSEQVYEPIRPGLVRFSADDFEADIEVDDEGFVVHYHGLARRVG